MSPPWLLAVLPVKVQCRIFKTALPALSIAPPLPEEAVLPTNVLFCAVQADPWFKMAPPEPATFPEKVQPVRVSRFELTMAPPAKPEAVELQIGRASCRERA